MAAVAHAGQQDKSGKPYILHPLRVMAAVHGYDEKIVAILHDTVEDTSVTLDGLRAAGFSDYVVDAIDRLTKRPGEDRITAAKRAMGNVLSRVVKLADVNDNLDVTRLPHFREKDAARIQEYLIVREMLLTPPPQPMTEQEGL